jgi:hypothetical protein
MSKDAYIKAHEQLIDEYLEDHPSADWTEAYEKTADKAFERARENYADYIDELRSKEK